MSHLRPTITTINFRLFILSQEKELQIHVFPGIPDPGEFCAGENTVSLFNNIVFWSLSSNSVNSAVLLFGVISLNLLM